METVETGVWSAFDALLWALLFLLLTAGIGLFTTFRCRRYLKIAGRPTRIPTLIFVLTLAVAMPFVGAFAGCAYSTQNSIADGLEAMDLSDAAVWVIDRGSKAIREELKLPPDDKSLVDLEKLRALAQSKSTQDGDGIEARFDRVWWSAITVALAKIAPGMTWGALYREVEDKVKAKVREELDTHAHSVRSTARKSAAVFLALLALANGLSLFFSWRTTRKPAPRIA
jgi:hypothetical protein